MPTTTLKQKIGLLLFAVMLFVVLLEGGLRVGGYVLTAQQRHRNRVALLKKGNYCILCSGGSTTAEMWPPYLDEFLNMGNIEASFKVIDKGRPAANTSFILSKLKKYLGDFYGQNHLKTLVLFQMTDGTSLADLHHLMMYDMRFKTLTHCPSVSKSQFSRSNAKRPVEAFYQTFSSLVDLLPKRLKIPLSLKELIEHIKIFDGTFIPLNHNYCPWAIYRTQFREPDAGMRMTIRLDLTTDTPDRIFVHPYRDMSANYFSACIDFENQGFLYLFDREYNRHATLEKIHTSGNYFITRLKNDMRYTIVSEQAVSKRKRHGLQIIKDQTIYLGKKKHHRISHLLRRIESHDERGNIIVFLTNMFQYAASTIAQLYRLRWNIEVFFKWIKQHLKVKRFISCSLNGILLQIYAALITYLLLALFKYSHKLPMSLYNVLRILKAKMSTVSPIIIVPIEKLKFCNQLSKNVLQGVTLPPASLMQH